MLPNKLSVHNIANKCAQVAPPDCSKSAEQLKSIRIDGASFVFGYIILLT